MYMEVRDSQLWQGRFCGLVFYCAHHGSVHIHSWGLNTRLVPLNALHHFPDKVEWRSQVTVPSQDERRHWFRNAQLYSVLEEKVSTQARNQDFMWGGANVAKVDQTTEVYFLFSDPFI